MSENESLDMGGPTLNAGMPLSAPSAKARRCVGFSLRHSQAKQCGVCPACLFRRQAMHVAGIAELEHSYKYDIFSACGSEPIPVDRLKYLKAFLMQVSQLDDTGSPGSNHTTARSKE